MKFEIKKTIGKKIIEYLLPDYNDPYRENNYLEYLDLLGIKGVVDIWLHEPYDRELYQMPPEHVIQEYRYVPNTVVDAGEIWIAELLAGEEVGGSVLTYTAGNLGLGIQYAMVGVSGTAVTQNNFDLDTSGVTGGFAKATTNDVLGAANNQLTAEATFVGAEGVGSLQEAGLFSNSTEPTTETDTTSRMFNRTTYGTITKTSGFDLTVRWTITIGALTA